jgi:hypothetical protein
MGEIACLRPAMSHNNFYSFGPAPLLFSVSVQFLINS